MNWFGGDKKSSAIALTRGPFQAFKCCARSAERGRVVSKVGRFSWLKRLNKKIAKTAFTAAAITLAPAAAFAQACTANTTIASLASSVESRNPDGSVRSSVVVGAGDFIVMRDVLVNDYNGAAPGQAAIDIVLEVIEVSTNSSGVGSSTGTTQISSAGTLALSGVQRRADSFISYRLIPMFPGSVTSTVASGTPIAIDFASVALRDIDSTVTARNDSDVGGILTSELPGVDAINSIAVELVDFVQGGGPAGFTTYTSNTNAQATPSWSGVASGGNNTHRVEFQYTDFSGGTYLHGFTGFDSGSSTRGANIAFCGTILEPGITTTKTIDSQVVNADGSVTVTYTATIENSGDQVLTGLQMTDNLDSLFAAPYDAFIPSTSADATGGVTAVDATATIIADTGGSIGTIATNSNFDGGADTNIFAVNTAELDPGDVVSVTFTILLEANSDTSPDDFTNSLTVTMTDEFNLDIESIATSNAVTVPGLSTPAIPALDPLVPGSCGAILGESYLLDGLGIGGEQNYELGSGSATRDPDVFFGTSGAELGYIKNADGSVTLFFDGEAPVASFSGDVGSAFFTNQAVVTGGAADQTDAAEFWRGSIQLFGEPGLSYSFVLDNGNAHEFIHYWVEDANGAVIDTSLGAPNSANGWFYGTGANASTSGPNPITADRFTTISYTIPPSNTDGVVIVNILLLDPQVGFGRLEFGNDVPECPEPELTLTKVADVEEPAEGQTVTYTYTATNDGNVTINDVNVADSHGGAGTLGAIELDSFTTTSATTNDDGTDALVDALGPGDTATFTSEYVVDAGDEGTIVSNTATADGDPVGGTLNPLEDRQATETVDVIEPGLEIIKSITGFTDVNSSGALDAGDEVTFEFTATNNGNVSLADITITDTGLSPITVTPVSGVALASDDGPEVVATATYVLTQADVAAGGIENTASGTAQVVETDGSGNPVPGTPLLDENGDPVPDVSDTSDAGTEPVIDLATGLPEDVSDPATEETENADGSSADSDPGNDPTALIIPQPDVEITKSVASVADTNGNGLTDAGDTISYTFTVENTGNTDLTDVEVTDDLAGIVITGSPISALAEGASDTSVTATYVLTPTDVAAGGVENSAEASGIAVDENGDAFGNPFDPGEPLTATDTSDAGTNPDGDPVANNELVETEALDGSTDGDETNDPTVFLIEPGPMIEIVKSIAAVNDENGNGLIDVGDTIEYAFTVSNTGNVALAAVTVTDALVAVSGGPISLDIGETDTTSFTATYEIDADDLAAGGVENTADVTGNAVDADGNEITDPITGEVLSAEDDSDSGSEPLLDASGDPIDEGDPDGTESPALDGSTDSDPTNDPTVLFIPNPELTVVKSLANALDDNVAGGDGLFGGDGDTLVFQFTVTNTGNVDLQNVTITDPQVTMTGGPIDLAIGAGDSLTFEGTYTVLPADTARGFFENTAEATGDAVDGDGDPIFGLDGAQLEAEDTSDTGTDPEGDPITDPANIDSDPNANPNVDGATGPDGDNGNDPTVSTIPGNPNPRLSVIKSVASVADTTGDGFIGEGDTVTYSFSVTNSGNLDLENVALTDNLAAVTGGPIPLLAIGDTDTTTFEATSVITAAQAAAGAIENSAEATGAGVNSAGDPITEGGVQVTATDTSDAGTEPELDVTGVPTAYTDPEGNETPDASGGTDADPTNDPTVLFLPMPEITIIKSVSGVEDTNGNGFTDAGDTVSYVFAVENTGNTDLINIDVTDSLPGIVVTGSPIAALAQDDPADTSVTATYVLTPADVAAGGVQNTAEATGTAVDQNGDPLGDPANPAGAPLEVSDTSDAGTDPSGGTVADPDGTETPDINGNTDGETGNDPTVFTLTPAPALTLTKSVSAINDLDGDGLPGIGDEVVYSFTVTNVGNVDLADVTIADPLGTVLGGPIDLGIGEDDNSTFTLVHEITAANIDDGAIENTAVATGTAVDASGDPIADPITGADLIASDDSDAGTEPELDASGLPADVTDPETLETPDVDGNTDGDPTNDPTVLVLPMPELTVVKSTANVFDTNGDGLFGGEDDEIEYQFTITNTGNVNLVNVSLTDSIAAVDGGPIDLVIGQGDSTTFTATYVVQAADIALGFVENTAEATGEAVSASGDPLLDLNGDPITVNDTSDTGTDPDVAPIDDPAGTESPDGEGTTDTDPGNDPTVTLVPSNPLPQIEVVKSIASITDDGDGAIGAGDTINYIFTVTNTGNVDLADVTVTDPTATVTGGPISLAVGDDDTTEFEATYVLTAADVAAGGVENTAVASGNAVNSSGDPILDGPGGAQLSASDDSDTGTEPEVNSIGLPVDIDDPAGTETPDLAGETDTDPTNDPTVLFIPTPGISVVKSLAAAPDTNGDGTFGGIGDVLTYSFIVSNTGNTALSDVVILDATATVSGGPVDLPVGGADTTSFTATYTVTANDVNVVGFVENSAEVLGDAVDADGEPIGNPVNPGTTLSVSDISDTGTDSTTAAVSDPEATETEFGGNGDGDTTNDPTVTLVPAQPVPMVEIIKSVASVEDTDGDAVLGGEDDVATYQFDVTNTGNTILVDVAVNDPVLGGLIGTIPSMAVGETVTLTVQYTITEADQTRGFIENTATADGTAENPLGTPLLDPVTGQPLTASDDSDTATDPSAEPVPNPSITETPDANGATDGDPTNDPTILTVPLAVPDTGLSGIVFFDDNSDGAFNGGDTLLAGYVVNLLDNNGNIIASTVSDANGFYELTGFPIGTHNVEFIDPASGLVAGMIDNLVFGRNTVLADQNLPVLAEAIPGQLILTKTTPLSVVSLGSSVPYTITAENISSVPVTTDIVDSLPIGFVYTPGSATIDGVVVEPVISGGALIWSGVTLAVDQTITLELVTRVGPDAPTGELVNTVNALDPVTGNAIAVPATAIVRREVEAIFDCSDVIGKVFDDRNFDGYQNPVNTGGITRQNIFSGKSKLAPVADPLVEPGLPRVRLVTPTGTIITTDEHGRYSVPCAELPREMGTNFTLKLDPRSLPTGYRVTTENPRSMRLTAGIMAEMNFGAAIGRVIDIDLTETAFNTQNEPTGRLVQGIDRLLAQVASEPTVLRLSYFPTTGETRQDIRDRLSELEDHIQARWRSVGKYRLLVETEYKSLQ